MGHPTTKSSNYREPRRLLTVLAAAKLLSVSKRTMQTRLAAGEIPRVQLTARCVRIRPEDLEKYIQDRLVT